MRQLTVDSVVRLTKDIPELMLYTGDVGIIRSTWFAPFTRYEVEFEHRGQTCNTRALLRPEQVQLEHEIGYSELADQDWFDQVGV